MTIQEKKENWDKYDKNKLWLFETRWFNTWSFLYHFHESLKSFIIKILFKKNPLWLHSPQGLSEYHYTLKIRPALNKIRFSNELKNFWILEFVFQQERKSIFLCGCACIYSLTNMFSTWLIISFSQPWYLHSPHTIQDKVKLLCRTQSQGPAWLSSLILALSPHNSNNMDHLPFPEITMKFPSLEPVNSTGTPVFFTSLTQTNPLDLSSAQIPVWKVVPLIFLI